MTDENKQIEERDGESEIVTTTTTAPYCPNEDDPHASFIGKAASLLVAYETWVQSHSGLARNVETTLYIAPQLIPKSVVEPEMATQFSYSLVGLLHLYHDYILWKKEDCNKVEHPKDFNRLVRVPLSLITHVQVLAEVVARRVGGEAGKWRLIVWVETIKGVLRLLLLAQRRRVMLMGGGKYKGVESAPRPSAFAKLTNVKQPGTRTGKTFGKATPSESEPLKQQSIGHNKITFEDATIKVAEDSREDLLVTGEICHILRPVVYALLRRHRPETSWTPVAVSLFVELSGLALSAAAVKPVEPVKFASADKAKDEIAARKMALLLYLLRDPVFPTVTKPVAGKTADALDYVPGVGKLFRFGMTAILDYYHQFYFYTSAS